jgi:hypothetical protein
MGQASTSPTKPKSIRRPNTLRPFQGHGKGPQLEDEDLSWRISSRSDVIFFVHKLYRGPSIWHQYGWERRSENTHNDPAVLFTCKMEPKQSRRFDDLDETCRSIIVALIHHRTGMQCDCDLEYITSGSTQKTSDICEIRDQTVLEAVKRPNKMCTCRVFQLVEQEKEEFRSSKLAGSRRLSEPLQRKRRLCLPKGLHPPRCLYVQKLLRNQYIRIYPHHLDLLRRPHQSKLSYLLTSMRWNTPKVHSMIFLIMMSRISSKVCHASGE